MILKKIVTFLYIFILCLCLFQPTTVNASNNPQNYGMKEIDENDQEIVEKALNGIIVKIGDKYYCGDNDVFYYLKDKYGDENFTGNSKFQDKKWNEIDTSLDNLDSATFAKKTKIYGGATMWTMEHTICNVLRMDQAELDKVLPLVELMKPIGFMICILYFLLDVQSKADQFGKSPQTMMFCFFKFATGITFVHASSYLVSVGYALSNGFLDMFMGQGSSLESAAYTLDELKDIAMKCDGTSIFSSVVLIIDALSGYLVDFFTAIIIVLMTTGCYARKLEIAIRSIFMPIGLADISGRGVQGPGMRYLKTLFACALHAGGIVALVQFATVFQVADVPFSGLAIPIALLGSINLVKKVAQEAFT